MSDFFNIVEPWAEMWAANLWRASWEGAVVLAIAWGIARWCTFLSPRIVCWVWRLACIKLLVILLWSWPVAIPLLPAKPMAAIVPSTASPSEPVSEPELAASPLRRDARLVSRTAQAPSHVALWNLLLPLWLAGVFCRITVTARQWRSVRRLCRFAEPVSSAALQRMCREEADRLAVRRLPQLRTSPQAEGPLLAGAWQPMIVLPDCALEMFDDLERRLMLAHELAHLKRRDLLWNWLPTLVGWLFFFHPLVWLMARRWSDAQEAACDELLIQNQVAQPAEYGRLLLKLSTRWPLEPRAALVTAGVLGTYRNLERRILAMAHVKSFSRRQVVFAAGTLSLVAAIGIIPWQLVAREPDQAASPDSKLAAAPDGSDRLPGRIYARAGLEVKTETGATEKYHGFIAIDANTGSWEKLGQEGHSTRISPTGDRLAFARDREEDNLKKEKGSDIFVMDLKNRHFVKLAEHGTLPVWSRDGKGILYNKGKWTENAGWHGPTWTIDLATNQTTKLPVPETDEVDDWSRQGDWLVTVSDRHEPFGSGYQLYVMHPDGTDERRLTEGALNCYPRFSPDGKQIVYLRQAKHLNSLWIVGIDGSNRKQLLIEGEGEGGAAGIDHACWSPDGKWLVVKRFDWKTEVGDDGKPRKIVQAGEGNERLEIIAPDGTSRGVLKLQGVTKTNWIETPDWN